VRFVAEDLLIEEDWPLDGPIPSGGKLSLHRGVYNRMVRDYGDGKMQPLTLTTRCDAPAGSGLGSSSTMVVSMIRAFDEAWGLGLSNYELAQLAFSIERVDVGLHGGKQDQYSAAFGGFNFMEFATRDLVVVNPLTVRPDFIKELETSLILFYTGKSRSSAAIIEEESRNVRERNEIAIDAMHRTKEEAFHMKAALLRGELRMMSEIIKKAWPQKKLMAKSISNPLIDSLYDTAIQEGAYCGKVSGAGGGGFMMFLSDPRKRPQVEAALNATGAGHTMDCFFTLQGAIAWRQSDTPLNHVVSQA
jgi:D-glycero-alpha-D-manno-heptose-7-phosphate kinase